MHFPWAAKATPLLSSTRIPALGTTLGLVVAVFLRRHPTVARLPLFVDQGDQQTKILVDGVGVLVEVLKALGKPEGTHFMGSPSLNLCT